MVRVQHGLTPRLGGAGRGQKRAQHADRGQRDLEVAHARKLQRFGQKPHDLRVCGRPRFADELHAHLRCLARLGLGLPLGLAEHALHIAETERPRLPRQARRAHAGDLQRDIRTHGQKVAARVEKLERHARQAPARRHDIHHLERRRLDRQIALGGHVLKHGAPGLLTQHGLVGQHIAKTRWRHVIHVPHPAFPAVSFQIHAAATLPARPR